jgi:hypothetical protein
MHREMTQFLKIKTTAVTQKRTKHTLKAMMSPILKR